jgi:hypothetical protein
LKDEEESDIEELPATEVIGVRKSARTEQIDFKAREEERYVEYHDGLSQ